jgi:protein-disulfide isomerase
MVENWKVVVGILVGTLVLVVVSAIGLAGMTNKERLSDEKLIGGAAWEIVTGEPKVTVVVFSDLQCPACRDGEKVARELRQMEGVRFVFRHFPLMTIHKNARLAALAVEAAKRMGKGWEMMEMIFDKQSEWSEASAEEFWMLISGYVSALGLNEAEFQNTMESEDLGRQIEIDESLGNELKLSGTPTFFVNGKMMATSLLKAEVEKLLDKN